jgi:hypothetical protein
MTLIVCDVAARFTNATPVWNPFVLSYGSTDEVDKAVSRVPVPSESNVVERNLKIE